MNLETMIKNIAVTKQMNKESSSWNILVKTFLIGSI